MKKIIYLIILMTLISFVACDVKPPLVTLEKYHKIATGMSYSQVVEIIGAPGTEMSRNEMPAIPGAMPGILTVMFMWQNSDGSNMNAMFQNNKLISKAQFGLR